LQRGLSAIAELLVDKAIRIRRK